MFGISYYYLDYSYFNQPPPIYYPRKTLISQSKTISKNSVNQPKTFYYYPNKKYLL